MILTEKQKSWLTTISTVGITIDVKFEVVDGELFVIPIVNWDEQSEELGTFPIGDKVIMLRVFQHTKLLFKIIQNRKLNVKERLICEAQQRVEEISTYLVEYVEVYDKDRVGQIPYMLKKFGYENVTEKMSPNLNLDDYIYMGVDHSKKIFAFFPKGKNQFAHKFRIKKTLYEYL